MLQYTIFGGSDGQIAPRGFSAVTLYGYSRLTRPTLAQRILNLKQGPPPKPKSWWERAGRSDRALILTVFGMTEIINPTLMEEYSALRSLLATDAVTPDECRELTLRILRGDGKDDFITFTVFGACYTKKHPRSAEEQALDAAESAGAIPRAHRVRLGLAVGAPPSTVVDVLSQLAAEPA